MVQVHVRERFPVRGEVVAQLQVASPTAESHVLAVSVGMTVIQRGETVEFSFPHGVAHFDVQRVERAVHQAGRVVDAIRLPFFRDDVYDAAHRVRPVQDRGRAAHHFHPFGVHRLVTVRQRMPHQAHVLRMSVDQHQHPGSGFAPYSPDFHTAGRAGRHAVPHHAASGDEQSGHLFGQHRQQRRFEPPFDLPFLDDRYAHRQVAEVYRRPRSGHDHFVHPYGVGEAFRYGTPCGNHAAACHCGA